MPAQPVVPAGTVSTAFCFGTFGCLAAAPQRGALGGVQAAASTAGSPSPVPAGCGGCIGTAGTIGTIAAAAPQEGALGEVQAATSTGSLAALPSSVPAATLFCFGCAGTLGTGALAAPQGGALGGVQAAAAPAGSPSSVPAATFGTLFCFGSGGSIGAAPPVGGAQQSSAGTASPITAALTFCICATTAPQSAGGGPGGRLPTILSRRPHRPTAPVGTEIHSDHLPDPPPGLEGGV